MPKPEAWRLELAAYPFADQTETPFQDLDPLGHINNVAFAALFENGRVRFNHSLGVFGERQKGERWLIAALAIAYLREAHFPEPMTIASGIGAIGTRSWEILSAAFQKGVCVATSETTLVLTGREGALPISERMREVLEAKRVRVPPPLRGGGGPAQLVEG